MNKNDAKQIAEKITNKQLLQMLNNAKDNIKDWTQQSLVNKQMTKGTAWNILAADFDANYKYNIMVITNMIREFGEFLPNELKPPKKEKREYKLPLYHQEPKFDLMKAKKTVEISMKLEK